MAVKERFLVALILSSFTLSGLDTHSDAGPAARCAGLPATRKSRHASSYRCRLPEWHFQHTQVANLPDATLTH